MSYLPPEKKKRSDPPTPMRMLLWVIVAGVGLYFVGTGIVGILGG
ncbi:hypothetical protein [Marisediminicola senii]|nr:hypothetical protein [Marisediminicola senii]